MKTVLRLSIASAAALLAVAVAGCGSATEGQPKPDDVVTSTETSSDEPPAEEPMVLSNTQLCELLSAEDAQSLGTAPAGEPGYSLNDGSPLCEWTAATGLTVVFQEGKQSKNTPSEPNVTITPTTIAGLTAVQSHRLEPNIDFCQYMVDITDNALMSAGATVNGGQFTSCEVAKQFVEIIVPKALDR